MLLSTGLVARAILTRVTRKKLEIVNPMMQAQVFSLFPVACIILSTEWLQGKYGLILFDYNVQGKASLPWQCVGDDNREVYQHGRKYGTHGKRKNKSFQEQA